MIQRLLLMLFVLLLAVPAGRAAEPARTIDFNRDIRPILSDTCFHCHGPDRAKRKANLRLDTEEGALADLGGRHAVVAGKLDESELIYRITAKNDGERMPPPSSGRKLNETQIDLLRRWIEQGAKWQKHWSLIPPQRPPLPTAKDASWPRSPIDPFILEQLERAGLRPSPEAEKTTLLRRVTLDLTGLPPTPTEVDAFLSDLSPDAYEKVVDRLLASPRYGERMVLEWLDAARYADSNGYQQDRTRTMWPWRDWVVEALNRNMPFDQFTIEQVAGDLLPNATVSQKIASGFHRNHPLNGEGGRIAEESRVDYVVDRVDTTATVWLGLTLGCARCHDHKYDPLTQKDFYQLYAYFNNIAETGSVDRGGNAAPVLNLPTPEQSARLATLSRRVEELEKRKAAKEPLSLFARLGLENALAGARKALDDASKSQFQVMVMQEQAKPRDSFILIRGAYDKYGEKVHPGVPAVLPVPPQDAPANRLGLARWLVDPANPLTARVTVNRHWQTFFGTGLVKTTEDFGVQGEPPSHPELLDWLATEFVRTGWDVKAMHRLIVTSAAYRQSSKLTPTLRERDPDNRLLARGPRHRLPSLVLRDQALAAGGLLVERLGGPSVKPYQPPGIWEEFSFNKIKYEQDKGESLYRRSLYIFWRRSVGPTMLFDSSSRQVCTVRQVRTNTPLQALILLNDITYVEAARAFAQRVLTEGGRMPDERVTYAFRLAVARKPSAAEHVILSQCLQRLLMQYRGDREAAAKLVSIGESPRSPKLDAAELAAYTGLAQVILNLDEVLCKE